MSCPLKLPSRKAVKINIHRQLRFVENDLLSSGMAQVCVTCYVYCTSPTGQERFGNMTRVYYKEAVGCFVVFDVTRASTFEAVQKWKNDLDSKVQLADGSPVPCVLLANKVI